ncbi:MULTISPECIES: SulP family inorganic anion transporter [Nitrosomonas]|uniref:High affinity sulfate transporter 1 n=1 Tax=Nitrosomonas communis TaxID=44574 RepID=A0A5D3YE18_9PROT|nr:MULTISPECIES: SulP family inorganic anion transporter [Nitrosomonas]TYP91582.1 high affinity sulfate transporter 1 [Nitrosomonas communis]UVS59859.1 SulP family inorganic anion transporter [Nitrosomonas sp. PLL12]
MLSDWIPLLHDLRQYRKEWFTRDVVAGLSVTAVQVPTAIAYANLAGFPPEVGLYASILPVLIYALFGSSRQLMIGPDAATCAMIAALLLPMAGGDLDYYLKLSAGMALTAGLLMVFGGMTRMGFIVNFFSRPILIGFLNGIALSIIAGQLGKLLGITVVNRDFGPSLVELAGRFGEMDGYSLGVGCATLVLLVLIQHYLPRAPAALIALLVAGLAVFLLGSDMGSVKLVGEVPSGLPSFSLPGLGYEGVQGIFISAVGLVIVCFTSGMLTARSFAARNGYGINADQEMRAIGFANMASGLYGGFAVTGADSRTAVNEVSGGKTQLVSVVAALATAGVVLFLTQPLGYLPIPALAAVLIFSAWGLLDIAGIGRLRAIDHFEFSLSLVTTVGVLAIGVLPGVVLAITLALLNVFIKIYRPADTLLGIVPGVAGYNDLSLSDDARPVPRMMIYRFDAPLLFFNADYFKARVLSLVDSAEPKPRWFVLNAESISQLDITGAQAVDDLATELQNRGVRLAVARPKLYMRKYGQPMGLGKKIGAENIFYSVHSAVETILAREAQAHKTVPHDVQNDR